MLTIVMGNYYHKKRGALAPPCQLIKYLYGA